MAKNNENWTPLDMLYFQDIIVGDQVCAKANFPTIFNLEQWFLQL